MVFLEGNLPPDGTSVLAVVFVNANGEIVNIGLSPEALRQPIDADKFERYWRPALGVLAREVDALAPKE